MKLLIMLLGGVSEGWSFIKYNSGLIQLWTTVTESLWFHNSWGQGYISTTTDQQSYNINKVFPNGLLKSVTNFQVSCERAGYVLLASPNYSSNVYVSCFIYSANNFNDEIVGDCKINFFVIGTWK